jgi:electron transfer flavoprotein alpha/beta subunit
MLLIIAERYINRANVIDAEDKPISKMSKSDSGIGGKAELGIQAQATQRTMTSSMTMKTMRTMKTGDINAT